MKRPFSRVILLAALVVAGFWSWRLLFPSPERVIRKHLAAVAQAASFSATESGLVKAYRSQKLAGFFTSDVQVTLDVPGHSRQTISGRDQVMQTAMTARSLVSSLRVEFVGLNVKVAPNNNSAFVNLTAKVTVPSEKDWVPQELNFTFQKVDDDWLIIRVETVKTLL